MVANFRLIRLKQILKKLAQTDYALRVRGQRLQVAEVLAVESAEDKVNLLFLVRDVAEGCEVGGEVLHRDHGTGRVDTDRLITWTISNQRGIWLRSKHIVHLSITEK